MRYTRQFRFQLLIYMVVLTTVPVLPGCAVKTSSPKQDKSAAMISPVQALYNEGVSAVRAGDLRKAQRKYQAALEKARVLGYEAGIGFSLAALGAVHQELQEYPRALELLSEALPNLKRTNNLAREALALVAIGEVHAQMGDNANTIEALNRALAIGDNLLVKASEKEKLVIFAHRAKVFLLKAGAHEKLEQFAEAVESYRQAATMFGWGSKLGIP